VAAVANAIGAPAPDFRTRRPIGSFLFLGPTGVGKTELARTLADFLFDDARPRSASTCRNTWRSTRVAPGRCAPRYVATTKAGS